MDISQVAQTTQKTGSTEAMKNPSVGAALASARTEDQIALSEEAVFLNKLETGNLEWGRSFTTLPPIPRTYNEISEWVSNYSDGLRSRMEDLFKQEDIQLQQDLTVTVDAQGQASIDPEHPQATQAQQALENAPELGQQLQAQQQRQQLAAVLNIGGQLRSADSDAAKFNSEQRLTQQINHPPAFELTIAAGNRSDAHKAETQALQA